MTCLTQVRKRAHTVQSIERVYGLKAYKNHWHIQVLRSLVIRCLFVQPECNMHIANNLQTYNCEEKNNLKTKKVGFVLTGCGPEISQPMSGCVMMTGAHIAWYWLHHVTSCPNSSQSRRCLFILYLEIYCDSYPAVAKRSFSVMPVNYTQYASTNAPRRTSIENLSINWPFYTAGRLHVHSEKRIVDCHSVTTFQTATL